MTNKDNNPTPTIILFGGKDIKVQGNKQYLVLTDKAGVEHKISEKRQALWGLFNNARDAEPFMLVYETYNNIQYVADAKPITDDLLKVAIRAQGMKVADAATNERNRSVALSYAVNLAVGNIIKKDDILSQAKEFYEFVKGDNKVALQE